jgi:hypothetical protein
VGRGKHKGRVNEGEYGGRIFVFIYENKREWNLLKLFLEGGKGKRENDGGGKSN